MAGEIIIAQEHPVAEALKESNPSSDGWKLIWADEFEKSGRPDPNNWTCETGFVRNNELQWYQLDNARCEKGLLIIEGRRERKQNPNYEPNSKDWRRNREFTEYTSSSLTTKGLHSWQYGRFEMRGQIDTRAGLWPAFWTLGVEGRWPACGEVDIMEYYEGTLLANVGWASENRGLSKWDSVRKPIAEFNDPNWSKKFHIWRMDWDDEKIEIYVDDILLNTTNLDETFNKDTNGKNPFRQPHFVLLNLAIGGTRGGDPSETEFPARFEVDYVRIYQKQPRNITTKPAAAAPRLVEK
jgi:beta-glucanase (GH16 family)